MPTIVEALKQKYPDATGNTIDEVIKNSGSGGGGGIEDFKAIPFISTGGFIKSFNPPVGFEYYTYEELHQLMDENILVYVYAINEAGRSRGFCPLVVNSGVICATCVVSESPWYDDDTQEYKGYIISYDARLTPENEFTCDVHNWYFPVTNDD